jgi:hypothetical protein
MPQCISTQHSNKEKKKIAKQELIIVLFQVNVPNHYPVILKRGAHLDNSGKNW